MVLANGVFALCYYRLGSLRATNPPLEHEGSLIPDFSLMGKTLRKFSGPCRCWRWSTTTNRVHSSIDDSGEDNKSESDVERRSWKSAEIGSSEHSEFLRYYHCHRLATPIELQNALLEQPHSPVLPKTLYTAFTRYMNSVSAGIYIRHERKFIGDLACWLAEKPNNNIHYCRYTLILQNI